MPADTTLWVVLQEGGRCPHRQARRTHPDIHRAVKPIGGLRAVPELGAEREQPSVDAHGLRSGVQG